MLSFFWLQDSVVTNHEDWYANAIDNEGSENAYVLEPEFKKVSAAVTDVG
jgi:hypothetical protein